METEPTRRCGSCSRDFVPSSRHKCCPRCRSGARWLDKSIPCVTCGVLTGSGRCRTCSAGSRTGSNSPTWKGGVTKHSRGYQYTLVQDHPRRNGKSGYVAEHILVMEEHIGRYLLKGENVHHKNGVRDDNCLENLELWSTVQPSGQRIEDKLKWAREIIELYGGIA